MNIFEAANIGNLNELKKFKVHGSDLKSKDGDGNSVFLWAASSGHLEILKWLFDEGIATIDEQNNAGNDALHLASAYGHTQLCKWLIDSGSSVNKENMFGSNALTIALKHNQLPVVDLLVRYFDQSLAQSSITYSNNNALNFYIKIVELFSHKPINHESILRVIEDASSQLHNDELSYIYLIYHWLNINAHGIDASVGAPQVFDANRLSLPHRTELLEQMFKVGVIATAEANQPMIVLDDAYESLVSGWLNVKTTDSQFLSKQNQTERDELYTKFYLTPLYRSITYALKINGDLNSALREPDKYYALNLPEGSFMDIDAARWTAYHLCRNNHISSAQHTASYKKTTGLSRRAYYDTVNLFLGENNDLQINTLLRELGYIPDSNGERLFWSVRYPVWLEKFNTTLGTPNSTPSAASRNGTLRLVGYKNVIHLSNNVSSIIWDVAKQELKPSTLPGNHLVYHLKEQGIYCKLYPGLPGINDAIQCLYRRLFGAIGGVPWSVTGLLEIGGQRIPVIISEDKGAKLVEDDARLAKLNQYALSKLILFSMITNPEDGKCDNYTLKQDTSGNFLIYSVDNDQGLVDGIIEADGWIFNSKKLSVKTVLFCLDSMNQPLHPQAVREFLALNSVEIIKEWLSDLVKLETEYNSLFKDCRKLFAAQKNPSWRSYSYQLMPIATVMNLAFKVQSLQSSLQANNSITAIALLKTVEFSIAGYYQKVLEKKELSATARFDELVKNEKLYGYNKVTKTYSTTLTSAKELFESFVPSNQASSVSPGIAREIFEKVTEQRQLITEIQTKILKGDITQLKSLSMREQQNLMKLIQFNQIDSKKSQSFLYYWAYLEKLTEIQLHHTQNNLLDWHLSYLLENNKLLSKLSLKNASSLTTLSPLTHAKNLTHLRLIDLPNIKKLKANLSNATDIILKDLPILTSIDIEAPKLERLFITNCPRLELLHLPSSIKLDNISIINCNQLPLVDFYNRWPGFINRLSEVPPKFRKLLAHDIIDKHGNSVPEQSEYIYKIVMNSLEPLFKLIRWLEKPNAKNYLYNVSVAILLSELHYDHPLVIETLRENSTVSVLPISEYFELITYCSNALFVLENEPEPEHKPDVIDFITGRSPFLVGFGIFQLFFLDVFLGSRRKFKLSSAEILNHCVGELDIVEQSAIDNLFNSLDNPNEYVRNYAAQSIQVRLANNAPEQRYTLMHGLYKQSHEFLSRYSKNKLQIQDRLHKRGNSLLDRDLESESILIAEVNQLIQAPSTRTTIQDNRLDNYNESNLLRINNNLPVLSTLTKLLSAADEGDLLAVKTLLHDKNNVQQIANNNQAGDTALSLAAKNSHFAVVDYLIRYHYLGISFNDNEVKALNLLSQNNQFKFYFQLLQLLTVPHKHKEIKSLLEAAKSACEDNDLSAIYLLYLWMNVHSKTQAAPGGIDSTYKEPSMSQLTAEHQSELILHMIREGFVLKDWYINSNELTLTDMPMDKPQVDAIERLLQQGQYQVCLKIENQPIEEGKIYVSGELGELHYTAFDRNGIMQEGLLSSAVLGYTFTAPITLDQLPSLPKLIEQISNDCNLRPSLEHLILSNVRFTKKYQLYPKKGPIFKNIFYVAENDQDKSNSIEYTVITAAGKRVTDTISHDELIKLGWNIPNGSLIDSLDPIFAKILEITSRRGHTIAENNTKGYSAFLALLNQFLTPTLQSLHLCDCDLFDDHDMTALYPVLAKCISLQHINVDHNHITETGLMNLLGVVNSHKKLHTLSLCFNDIEVKTSSALSALTRIAGHVQNVIVTGNRIADNLGTVKKNHLNRIRALLMLFNALSSIEGLNLTIEAFLNATNIELVEIDKENYLFSMLIIDSGTINVVSRKIDVVLTEVAFGAFNDLCLEEIEKQQQKVLPLTTPQDIFSYLISKITPSRIGISLASSTVSPDKEVCRQLLYHHLNAPIKGQLLNHSLFRTEKITTCSSFLYPNEQITAFGKKNGQGLVYLIANDRSLISRTEHAMLAYEYLTSYGQHVFKVVHLKYNDVKDITRILFEKGDINFLTSWLPYDRLIARFRVDSHLIKKMHISILEDTEYTDLPEVEYCSVIPGSSVNRDQKMMNCLTYCLKKMRDHLNIRLVANPIDYRPSAFVRKCIKDQSLEEENMLAP